jgi:hypothetical protein
MYNRFCHPCLNEQCSKPRQDQDIVTKMKTFQLEICVTELRAMFWIHFLDIVFAYQRKSKPTIHELAENKVFESTETMVNEVRGAVWQ